MRERRRPAGIWIIVALELFNAASTLLDQLAGIDLLRGGPARLVGQSEAARWVVIAWAFLLLVAAVSLWLLSRRGWVLMMVLVGAALAATLVLWWVDPAATNWLRLTLNVIVAFYLNSAQVRDLFITHREVSRIALGGRAKT